jgi:hypothetical protein
MDNSSNSRANTCIPLKFILKEALCNFLKRDESIYMNLFKKNQIFREVKFSIDKMS